MGPCEPRRHGHPCPAVGGRRRAREPSSGRADALGDRPAPSWEAPRCGRPRTSPTRPAARCRALTRRRRHARAARGAPVRDRRAEAPACLPRGLLALAPGHHREPVGREAHRVELRPRGPSPRVVRSRIAGRHGTGQARRLDIVATATNARAARAAAGEPGHDAGRPARQHDRARRYAQSIAGPAGRTARGSSTPRRNPDDRAAPGRGARMSPRRSRVWIADLPCGASRTDRGRAAR